MTTLSDKLFGTFLGAEFKEDSVVITCLKNNLSGMTLLSSAVFQLRDNDAVINEVREYIDKQGADISRVFVSIPDKWAITKFTSVPSMKGKGRNALANLMKFETERHIPFAIDDVAYDFLVLDEKDKTYSVALVAVRKEKIDLIKEFFEKLSMQIHAVTPVSFAVLNAAELSGISAGGWQEIVGIIRRSHILGRKNESSALLYIDKTRSSLSIIRDGLCIQMRFFDSGQPPGDFLDDISGYLAQVRSRYSIERFNKIMISGDVSAIKTLKEDLGGKLETKGIMADEVSDFSGTLAGVDMKGLAPAIGASFTGLGIGTYGINMLPHKTNYAVRKIAPLTTKVFLVLILVLIVGIFATEAVKQKRTLTIMEEILRENAPAIKDVERLSSEIKSVKERRDYLRSIKENEIAIELLAELAVILPKDAWITNLNYKRNNIKDREKAGGELVLNGYADSSSNLIPILEDSVFFEKVAFVGPIKKARGKEQFKISAQVAALNTEETDNEGK